MNLTGVLAELYRRLGSPSSPASATSTRLTAFVNETLQEVIAEPGIGPWLARHEPPFSFPSVAGQAVYTVPGSIQRIDAIADRTNRRKLGLRDLAWYRAAEPDPTVNTGVPDIWIPLGFSAVAMQPAAATGLWAVSSSASDTTQAVKVETVRTGGYVFSGSLTLNGTTRVALGTFTDHTEVTKCYLSAVCVGAISLYDAAASGNELARIAIGQTFGRYQALALWPTPAAVLTYTVDGERDLPDMSNTTDEAPIPPRLHEVLVDGALAREYEKTDDSRAAAARGRYAQKVARLKYFVTCPPDFLPSRGGSGVEHSRFGAYFPADRG